MPICKKIKNSSELPTDFLERLLFWLLKNIDEQRSKPLQESVVRYPGERPPVPRMISTFPQVHSPSSPIAKDGGHAHRSMTATLFDLIECNDGPKTVVFLHNGPFPRRQGGLIGKELWIFIGPLQATNEAFLGPYAPLRLFRLITELLGVLDKTTVTAGPLGKYRSPIGKEFMEHKHELIPAWRTGRQI